MVESELLAIIGAVIGVGRDIRETISVSRGHPLPALKNTYGDIMREAAVWVAFGRDAGQAEGDARVNRSRGTDVPANLKVGDVDRITRRWLHDAMESEAATDRQRILLDVNDERATVALPLLSFDDV